jgi:hypothetical protein
MRSNLALGTHEGVAMVIAGDALVLGGASAAWAAIPDSDDGEFHAFVKNAASSSSHDVTDTASCESLRLQLVELGLGDRSRVEELFGRRDLIGARAATARGDD